MVDHVILLIIKNMGSKFICPGHMHMQLQLLTLWEDRKSGYSLTMGEF